MMNDETFNPTEHTLNQSVEDNVIYESCEPLGIDNLLKNCRQKYLFKQKQLANLAYISEAEICRIESGTIKKPKVNSLIALSPYLGQPFSHLLEICGYSFDMDQEIYYNKKNKQIPYLEITKDIYNADADLLEALQNINQLDLSEIILLTNIIIIMKKCHNLNDDHLVHNKKTRLISRIFQTTKDFLSTQLNILNDLFGDTAQQA